MTAKERQVWIAVYAASWHHVCSMGIGRVTDVRRAELCVEHANRALTALREYEQYKASDIVREVLA